MRIGITIILWIHSQYLVKIGSPARIKYTGPLNKSATSKYLSNQLSDLAQILTQPTKMFNLKCIKISAKSRFGK